MRARNALCRAASKRSAEVVHSRLLTIAIRVYCCAISGNRFVKRFFDVEHLRIVRVPAELIRPLSHRVT